MADTADASAPDAAPATDAKRYLDMIVEAERYFQEYQEKADNVDKLYADLAKMASTTREREMQVFWANLEVLKPSIYARPPTPVVIPRFKDRKELPRTTAELTERALVTSFSTEDIDATMRLVRDDLAINGRGVTWLRYDDQDGEEVCYDHIERKDFLHEPARKWKEVGWVARRSYLNRKAGLDRFGDVWLLASFKEIADGDDEKLGRERKAAVWELWHRGDDIVVWVTPGVEQFLDRQSPYLTLEEFFPCPRPAYGTLQRRTLKPIPELLYYKDQIEEINELTARISALSEALRLKGFYAAGASELADAIEAALKAQSNNAILIPVSNFASLGGAALKDAIVWLPIRDVAEAITQCVALRKQLIEDVYQVTGLSDIMRGATDPNETLGAQQLKSQYGSIRIRDRQAELVRFARDITRLAGEIMAENFSPKTLLEMSQMDVATNADVAKQVKELTGRKQQITALLQRVQTDPQLQQKVQQVAQQNPDQAKQIMQKVQAEVQQIDGQIGKLQETVTIEQIMAFLRDQRMRAFMLDIETDSTIAPDENAQKQRATEFVTATGGFMGQVLPLVQATPQLAPLAAEFLKYVAGQFRAGRELEGVIDEFADQMAQMAQQPRPPDPAQAAMQQKMQTDQMVAKADLEAKQLDAKIKTEGAQQAIGLAQQESAAKIEATKFGMQQAAQKHAQDMQKGALEIEALKAKTAQTLAQGAQGQAAQPAKPPSESIAFGDLPAEGQSQMAAQAGIHLTPAAMAAHTAQQDAKAAAQAAQKAAVKPKPAAPPA